MQKIISIDLYADFGMLKKPDTNEPIYLTFNMLHKPALLGILGAIIGEAGFKRKGELPKYYLKLENLKVGIQPLKHEKGNFQKTVIAYNNTTGMASKETGGNLIVNEQTLIAPAFRCYFLLDMENDIHIKIDANLSKNIAEYLPYLGKNEFSIYWKAYKEYSDAIMFVPKDDFKIISLYIKDEVINENKVVQPFSPFDSVPRGDSYIYFERLPVAYNKTLLQYEYKNFAYTDWTLKQDYNVEYSLFEIQSNEVVQLF